MQDPYELKKGMIRVFILQKQTMSILPFNEETQRYKKAISYNILFTDYLNQEDYENREPMIDETLGERQNIGINEIDEKIKYDIVLFEGKIIDYDEILDDHNDSDFEDVDLFESLEETIIFRDELISKHLNEKKVNENESINNEEKEVNKIIYDTDDVRKLLVQLSESDTEIKLSVSDRYFGRFQLENNLTEDEFDFVDSKEYQDFDPKKPIYTGTTIYREYECEVSNDVLIDYLKKYIESSEFNEDEMDLDSFLRWGDHEYGHSFEEELDCGKIKEVIDVQGKEIYLVSMWEMEEHRNRHMVIEFNSNSNSPSPEIKEEEKTVENRSSIESIERLYVTHSFMTQDIIKYILNSIENINKKFITNYGHLISHLEKDDLVKIKSMLYLLYLWVFWSLNPKYKEKERRSYIEDKMKKFVGKDTLNVIQNRLFLIFGEECKKQDYKKIRTTFLALNKSILDNQQVTSSSTPEEIFTNLINVIFSKIDESISYDEQVVELIKNGSYGVPKDNFKYDLTDLEDFLFNKNFNGYLNQFINPEYEIECSNELESNINKFIKINENYHERDHGAIKAIIKGVFKMHQVLCATMKSKKIELNKSLEDSFIIIKIMDSWFKSYIEKTDDFYFDFVTQPKGYVEGYLEKIINSFDECFLEISSFVPKNDIDKIFIFTIRSMKKISLELLIRDVRQRED